MKNRIIDFHAHILPGCDHGSRNVKTSLKQLSLASQAGIDVICATSHFYAHKEDVEAFLERRERSFSKLKAELNASSPQIVLGAEVLAFEGIERLPGLEKLCLSGTNMLLLEMPFTPWTEVLIESVEKLCEQDRFKIILAHVERYDEDDIDYLCSLGALCQVNADSFSGLFTKKHLKNLVAESLVAFVGSDIHGTDSGYTSWAKMKKRNSRIFEAVQEESNRVINQFK